ncbi:metallophosphoesterase [Tenacibaculum amylolyticum]|uniref:metallophosphoesterase n=1 Tax=Tenacibaculum amylolyticum TaxID=104269 RepID=UPI0038960F41
MTTKRLFSAALLLIITGCASYKAQYLDKQKFVTPKNEQKPVYSFYLIGDAGNAKDNKAPVALNYFEKTLDKASKNSAAIFLGDNIYPYGMYPKSHPDYELTKHRLQVQIDALKDYKGQPIFIPGNHDWYNGVDGLKRQEKMVEKALGKNSFLPENGCGLDKININDELTLITIDSRWFIMDWDEEPKINDNCDIRTRERFIEELWSLFKKNRYKNVVVAMHHPLYSNGPHGGSFSFKDHMSPIPVLGTLKNVIRSHAGIQTDNFNQQYNDLVTEIETIASDFKNNIVFVSGHEHNLQYINNNGFKQVISGSGSKTSPALIGYGAEFTYGNYGYAQLNFYKDGSAVIEYYAANDKDGNKLLFSKQIIAPFKRVDVDTIDFSEYNAHKKEVTTSLYPKDAVDVSGFHKFMWGDLNREKYGKEITVPVLELDKVYGGLKPIRRGGGNQTNSLRLENPEGKQYVLRSMYKDGSRIMGGVLKGTFLVDVVQDIFTMSHPYAAFVIPDMAEAAGIYHTNPKLYYMPKQPALGMYNDVFGGGLYLLEERPSGNREDIASFGNSKKIISTYDVLEKIRKNGKHSVDQNFAIRSRLFDMVIGDWDRHEDQWRFASFKTDEGKTYYRPIPRDRDQPFSKFDGLLIPLFKLNTPLVKNMQSMGDDIKDMKWYNNYPRFFDAEFLNQLTLDEWLAEADYVQKHLTDDVIEASIKKFPKNIYDIDGKELISQIKSRRDKLKKFAREYYKKQAKKVQVVGTDKDDKFIIKRLNDDETSIEIFRKDIKIYDRIFKTDETDEVQLYGLNGEDEFYISGDVDDGILIRLIGGRNHDTYNDTSSVAGWSKKTKVYDFVSKKNTVKGGKELADLREDNYFKNTYNHRDIENNTTLVFPSIGFNPDDGLFFGVDVTHTRYGFKKRPFDNEHNLTANYYSSTSGFDVSYAGEFSEFIGKWSLELAARATSSNYAFNFFGWGNQSVFDQNFNLDFYRVKKEEFNINSSLVRRYDWGSTLKLTGSFEAVKVENTPGRNISSANFSNGPINIFDRNYFVGGEVYFNHHRVDNESFPTKGMDFDLAVGAKMNTEFTDRHFGYLKTSLAIYQNLVPNRSLVFASEIGSQINFRNRFQIYHAAVLGGNVGLRGYNNQRFTGTESFYHMNDLRLRLASFKAFIPLKLGVTSGFDYGKVWSPFAPASSVWNSSYGGSVWLSGLDMFTANISLFKGDDGNRFSFSLGFNF